MGSFEDNLDALASTASILTTKSSICRLIHPRTFAVYSLPPYSAFSPCNPPLNSLPSSSFRPSFVHFSSCTFSSLCPRTASPFLFPFFLFFFPFLGPPPSQFIPLLLRHLWEVLVRVGIIYDKGIQRRLMVPNSWYCITPV